MSRLFLFGFGYCARHFLRAFEASGGGATATATSRDGAGAPAAGRVELLAFSPAGSDPRIPGRIAESAALLASIPPDERGDPAMRAFRDAILRSPTLERIVYLSSTGVYGDHGGAWIDETAACVPSDARSALRLEAENGWRSVGSESGKAVHVLRLGGIYGPGRNALEDLRNGTARRVVKPGLAFNRIHVEDIARAIAACLANRGPGGTWNVVDDEPAPPQDVVAYAAALAGVEPPPEIPFEAAGLSTAARAFYADSKRCANRALRRELGVTLAYPTYREGLRALNAGLAGPGGARP
jgi:nucleoside-diphosphate-sugar epimerase